VTRPLDDATAAYILETRRGFEDLRQVASQLAGLLVLAAAGAKSAPPDCPMLESSRRLFEEAADGLRSARFTARARAHHQALLDACGALGESLAGAEASLCAIDPVLLPLRGAYSHLERASRLLPGFEMVSFDHACCARTA